MVKLVLNGATYKNLNGSKDYVWAAIAELQGFVQTKGDQALLMHKNNRHITSIPCKQKRPSTCSKIRK